MVHLEEPGGAGQPVTAEAFVKGIVSPHAMPQGDEVWGRRTPGGRLRGRLRGMSASTVTTDGWIVGTCRVVAPPGRVTRREYMRSRGVRS